MITSGLYRLNADDFMKGLLVSVGGAIVGAVQTSFHAGHFTLDWQYIWGIASASFISYLSKNFFTSAKNVTRRVHHHKLRKV